MLIAVQQACIESELGQAPILGCAGTNITCLCFNVAFLGAIGECSNLNCTAPETNATLAFVIELCEGIIMDPTHYIRIR